MLEPQRTPRQRIIDGARQAFLTYGYDGASMRTITEFTGYSQAGISHYFPSKASLLSMALDQSFERLVHSFTVIHDEDPELRIRQVWQNLTQIRDDVALSVVVSSEACVTDHPAETFSLKSLDTATKLVSNLLPALQEPQIMAAIWQGLVIDWLYRPRLDVPDLLIDAYQALIISPEDTEPLTPSTLDPAKWNSEVEAVYGGFFDDIFVDEPHPSSREREILDAAMQVFGDAGYAGGSLRNIAQTLGVTHPALLRYYPTKDDLFKAVLQRRDMITAKDVPSNPRESLAMIKYRAEGGISVPGLVKLFTAVDARSFQSTAPFHDFFIKRSQALNKIHDFVFELLGEDGQIRSDLDPIKQGRILLALWDGIQIRWTLDPDNTSVPETLIRYINRVLVSPITDEELVTAEIKIKQATPEPK